MVKHPYKQAPTYTKWRQAVAEVPAAEVDPGVGFPFRLTPRDKVATAGSCFSQHIGRALKARGFAFLVTEPPHPFVGNVADQLAYTQFSARYGNVYTARQMLQLVQRAEGLFVPADRAWEGPDGGWFDPYRPTVQPGGFLSTEELEADRARHLGRVRTMLRELDYLVFTLGLTEVWTAVEDGAAYPLCPGVAAGAFDPDLHHLVDLGVDDVVADIEAFFALIRAVNNRAKLILTVSPVAIAASVRDRHVLVSNAWSKSVLRVAADIAARRHPDTVAYFPSYEMITGAHARSAYVLDDLRTVSEAGVAQAMSAFARHALDATGGAREEPAGRGRDALVDVGAFVRAECDEVMLGA